eukprot:TRINITY_DN21353_c3_g1_i1.p1 TRINITY_DN21353_c3_g1~~TRINITY_DN21353_c3_g1_i1.p1  ORF type:complete len:1571 (+),score=412.13 TRINITY_DN21353_c3_g1_i1:289-5001(+)
MAPPSGHGAMGGAGGLGNLGATLGVQSEEARAALQQLMQANGLKQEDLQNPDRVTHIEMVLDDYCCMQTLNLFPKLRYVCLIQQAIAKIEGLQKCQQLERLILNENRIQCLEGLNECVNLKQLCICTNEIDAIGAGLQGLSKLEKLWLADNRISVLEGLRHTPALTELNIARNRITTTRFAFDGNPHLRVLNLSDNRLSSHLEVLGLARYRQIKELCFADPDWGENRLCQLCNYVTYTLFHMPQLVVHDRMKITDEDHDAAQAAFFKKSLYYNMRIKLVKRQAADALRLARTLHEERLAMLRREVEAVARILRRFDATTVARKLNPPGTQPSAEEMGEGRDLAPLQKQLRDSKAELSDATAIWNTLETAVHAEVNALTRDLQMELQTGGNLRTEVGDPAKDTWARQIEELVKSRFRAEELEAFGIADVRVSSVTRIHNRSLRIRFEDVLDSADVDTSTQFEYLFYVPDPANATADIRTVIGAGFGASAASSPAASAGAGAGAAAADASAPGAGETGEGGGQEPASTEAFLGESSSRHVGGTRAAAEHPRLLTNSVGVAEACRLRRAAASPTGQAVARALQRALRLDPPGVGMTRLPSQPPVECCGQLLVCSVFIPSQSPDIPSCFDSPEFDVREQWRREPSGTMLEPSDFGVPPDASSKLLADDFANNGDDGWRTVYRTSADDPRQKVWHTANPDAVLPEFLVEFDYVFGSPLLRQHAEKHSNLHPPNGLLGSTFRSFGLYACLGVPPAVPPEEKDDKVKDGAKDKPPSRNDVQEPPATCTLAVPLPEVPEPPQIEVMDSSFLLRRDMAFFPTIEETALKNIKVLSLHGRGIRRIDESVFDMLPLLKVLILSFNAIESISWFPTSSSIMHLDVSFNFLQTVNTLRAVPSLRHLDLSWNSVLSVDTVAVIARDVPELETLVMIGNPLAHGKTYVSSVLGHLPKLKVLDEREVTQGELQEARAKATAQAVLTQQVLMEHSYAALGGARGDGTVPSQQLPGRFAPTALASQDTRDRSRISTLLAAAAASGEPAFNLSWDNWRESVEAVDVSGLDLQELCDLNGLKNVRELRLSRNEVSSLLQVAPCTSLEALAAEENGLASLEGVSSLTNLRRLDVSMNRLTSVLELSKLPKLSQLSLEDNYIDSLDTFPMLRGLMELYLSNNLIEELRSVLMLKQLPKLIVLDLSGNELCRAPDYRCYTIFHLRRLKVLDGKLVTPAEHQEADDKFSGKVTLELLEDKLGPTPACYSFRSVDLSGMGLRDLGNLLNDDMFPSLRELCLDGNPFTSIKNLGPLAKLLVLRLNRTKLDLDRGVLGEGPGYGGFATLRHLQVLEMGSCGINDMSHFARIPLTALRILHLQGNDIAKLEGISHMEQLRELVLDRNKIKQFDEGSFAGLRALRELRIEDNGLKSLEHLGPLPRLHALHLSSNRIAEVNELEHMRNLRHLVIVHLAQNPVSRKPLYRAFLVCSVRSLRAIDGKEVTEEERERSDMMLNAQDPSKAQNIMGQGVYVFTDASQVQVQSSGLTSAFVGSGIVGGVEPQMAAARPPAAPGGACGGMGGGSGHRGSITGGGRR